MPMAGCHKPRGKYIVTGGKAVDAEQMKKLLELLEQALKCEQVATITITIKPNQKPKQ